MLYNRTIETEYKGQRDRRHCSGRKEIRIREIEDTREPWNVTKRDERNRGGGGGILQNITQLKLTHPPPVYWLFRKVEKDEQI